MQSFTLFGKGLYNGFAGGVKSTGRFLKSLGTLQGWKNLGQGFLDMADAAQGYSARGMMLRTQAASGISDFAGRIPDMSAYDAGYAIGYGVEKVGEAVLISKGAGAVGNVVRGSNMVSRTGVQAIKTTPVELTTSSGSLAPARTYSIYNRRGVLQKFGVTDANLARYNQSLKAAGPGAYGKYSQIMYKGKAHATERYLRSLHYNSTGKYAIPRMKIPYPVDFSTGLRIKPF